MPAIGHTWYCQEYFWYCASYAVANWSFHDPFLQALSEAFVIVNYRLCIFKPQVVDQGMKIHKLADLIVEILPLHDWAHQKSLLN